MPHHPLAAELVVPPGEADVGLAIRGRGTEGLGVGLDPRFALRLREVDHETQQRDGDGHHRPFVQPDLGAVGEEDHARKV